MFDRDPIDLAARELFNRFFEIDIPYLDHALAVRRSSLYRTKLTPKKSGGVRILHPPCDELSIVQSLMLNRWYEWAVSPHLHAYRPGVSILTNAQAHLRKSTRALGIVANAWLVKMDLKDAFPSVTERILRPIFANRIFCLRPPKEITRRKTPSGHRPAPDKIEREAVLAQRMFRERFVVGLRRVAAVSGLPIEELRLRFVDLMIYLTLWKGHLPQGAPTSPYLINVVLTETGVLNRLYEEANWRDCIFTMYCDDMTITCPFKPSRRFMTVLRKCLHGFFRINPEKTHVSSLRSQAHSITGLKLTRYARKEDIAWVRSNGGQVHITLAQRKIKRMRAVLHRITPFLLAGKEPIKEEDGASLDVAKGYIAHLTQVFGEKSNFPSAIKEPVRKFEEAYAKFCSLKTK